MSLPNLVQKHLISYAGWFFLSLFKREQAACVILPSSALWLLMLPMFRTASGEVGKVNGSSSEPANLGTWCVRLRLRSYMTTFKFAGDAIHYTPTQNKCKLVVDTWITFLKVRQSVNRLSDNLDIRKAVAYPKPRQLRYYVILNYIIIQTGVDWIFRQVNKQSTLSTTNLDGLINACLDFL